MPLVRVFPFQTLLFFQTGSKVEWSKQCAVSNIFCANTNPYSSNAEVSQTEISSQEEDNMHRSHRYLFSSILLTAAIAAPTAMMAATRPQDNGRQEENHRDEDHNRVYDRSHNDYHNWDDNENRFYRQYLTEKHRAYRAFGELKEKEQRTYWNWRHSHPDHDREHEGR
jgi:hypothetical protein